MKAKLLADIRAAIAAGKDVATACRASGVPKSTFHRWLHAEASAGLAGLKDRKPTGRPKSLELTKEETLGLRGHSLLAGSMDGGVARWMEESAKALEERDFPELTAARPDTLAVLTKTLAEARAAHRRPSWPSAVRTAARTSTAEDAHLRGGKGMLSVTPSARRAMIWQDEAGVMHQVMPGSIWESDDMSDNEPFRYFDAELGRETVGRQSLLTGDVFSHALLGGTKIGRRRDAYRVEDIADHLRDIVSLYGLPLIWRFEKGVWDNHFIYGIKAPPSWLLGDDFRFGGFDGHLFRVAQKHSSRGKAGIENCFGPYQDFMKHKSTSIGAYRGEFDRAARLYRAALNGVESALKAWWTMGESAAGMVAALGQYNVRPQLRRAFGGKSCIPAELWAEHKARACPADEMWRFLPVKRPITVRQGVVEMRVEHYPLPFRFLCHGSTGLPCFDEGHRVFVAFHPGQPDLGCQIFNGELPNSTRNRDRIRLLEPLGMANWWPDVPQENFSATAGAYDAQKKASAALRAEFRAAFPGGAGALISRSNAKDIYGRLAADPIKVADPAAPERKPRKTDSAALVALYGSAAG